MAAALQYLRENDLMDYEALAASTEKAVERFHTLSEELRQTEAELEKTSAHGGYCGLRQNPACV